MNTHEKDFLRRTRQQLDESADSLDAATLSRLNQARQKAVQQLAGDGHRGLFAAPAVSMTAMAAFSAAAVAIMFWTLMPPPSGQMQDFARMQAYEDMEMLVSDADFELLEELEFISWLVEETPDDSFKPLPEALNGAG